MSEFVTQSIEDIIPELQHMQEIGLFTSAEAKQILKKRNAFEYKLRRRTKEKKCFLQYIQYEMNVLTLVKRRRKQFQCGLKKEEIDIRIIKRIHKLFQLACTRFQNDVKLWLSHIEFSKSRNEKKPVSRLFTSLLKFHPHKTGVWVLAAKWEMDKFSSMENARSLLQQALRINPKSKHIWQEYYRMELINAEAEEQNKLVRSGEIARAVFRNAMTDLPGDVDFCLSFIPICQLFPFATSSEEDIFMHLKQHFGHQERAVAALARRPLHNASLLQPETDEENIEPRVEHFEDEAYKLFEEALCHLSTQTMWEFYLETCVELIEKVSSVEHHQRTVHHALDVFSRASERKQLSETMSLRWLDVLVKTGQIETALRVSNKMMKRFKQSVPLWRLHLVLRMQCEADSDGIVHDIDVALTSVVMEKDSIVLWMLALEWCTSCNPSHLTTLLEAGITNVSKDVQLYAKELYMDWAVLQCDVRAVRKLYKRLTSTQPISIELFNKYMMMENTQLNIKMSKVRRAYNNILRCFGSTDIDLWLRYIKLEMSRPSGQRETVGQLYWKAMKELDASLVDEFASRYAVFKTELSL